MKFEGTFTAEADIVTKEYVDSKVVYLNGGIRNISAPIGSYAPENGITFFNKYTNALWSAADNAWTVSGIQSGVVYIDNSSNSDTHHSAYVSDNAVPSPSNPRGATLMEVGARYDNTTSGLTANSFQGAIDEVASDVAGIQSAISSLGNISEYKIAMGTIVTNADGLATINYSAAGFTEVPKVLLTARTVDNVSTLPMYTANIIKSTVNTYENYTTTECAIKTGLITTKIGNLTVDWIAIGK